MTTTIIGRLGVTAATATDTTTPASDTLACSMERAVWRRCLGSFTLLSSYRLTAVQFLPTPVLSYARPCC